MKIYNIGDDHDYKNKSFFKYIWEFVVTDYYEP